MTGFIVALTDLRRDAVNTGSATFTTDCLLILSAIVITFVDEGVVGAPLVAPGASGDRVARSAVTAELPLPVAVIAWNASSKLKVLMGDTPKAVAV